MWSLFRCIGYIFLIIPESIVKIIWRMLDVFDGKIGAALRYIIICKKLGSCGTNVFFASHIFIDNFKKVHLGSNVSIHRQTTLLAGGGIYIGDNVSIAHNSSLVSGNHTWDNQDIPIKYNPIILSSVKIDNDVWIGCGVRILSGVSIASRTIVAAGAVVNKSLKPKSIYGGIPAKLLKKIND